MPECPKGKARVRRQEVTRVCDRPEGKLRVRRQAGSEARVQGSLTSRIWSRDRQAFYVVTQIAPLHGFLVYILVSANQGAVWDHHSSPDEQYFLLSPAS